MATPEALILQMSVDLRRMEKSLNQARGATNRQLKAVEDRFDRMNAHVRRSGDQMARDLRSSIAAIGVTVAIREVTQYADAWTSAQNKLAAAGVAQGQLNATMKDLANLAQETRSGLEGTVDLYARLTRAGQQLGLTQAQIRDITRTTLQAFVAGGAAASEQAAAITQLSQALGSGVLQGDELRSIRENAPLLAQAIADEFNTTIAGLKKLGEEGELTADRVARAILNADGISDAFGRTITTVAQAMENLRTEFTRYISESRVAQTVIQALGGFIQFVTDNLDLLADAAIVAATVIGGTLAAGAIARFTRSLVEMTRNVRAAESGMQRLRLAMTFFSGPIGAILLGIGGALASMALSSLDSASAAERAADSLEKLGNIRQTITSQTADLQAAQERLNKAIREGGEAARIAGALEVDRLRKLLEGSRALFQLERARAQQALNDRSTEFRTKNVDIPGLYTLSPLRSTTLERADFDILTPALRRRRQTIEEFSADIGSAARIRSLTEEEKALSNIASAILAYREEMRDLTKQVEEYDKVLAETALGGTGKALPFPELDAKDAGGSAVRGYRTELEQLRDTLKEIGEEAARDAKFIEDATIAVKSLLNTDQTAEGFTQAWRDANEQLGKAQEDAAQRAAERSRQAVQAVLDFAQSGGIAQAFGQVPNIRDLLVGDDEALLIGELQRMAQEAAAAVAVGFDAAVIEHQKRMEEIAAARAAAIAAGEADLSAFERAEAEANAELERTFNDSFSNESPYDIDQIHQAMMGAIDELDFVDAGDRLRQVMRDSVKSAMREGIRTGDWGDAFRMVLADAITEGLDDALNRVADWLTDFLFGQNGFLAGLIEGAGNWAGQAIFGGRPTGGAALAGRGYRVNDRGDGGEFLFMGSNAGQVLRAADIAALAGPARGGGAIDASVTFTGPIDATNLDEVRRMLEAQRRQIMAAMPAATRATIMADRRQGAHGWRKQ